MIIDKEPSIVVALDVDFDRLKDVIKATDRYNEIGAYKIGFQLGLEVGLRKVVDEIKSFSSKPIIYDHQKAATDIPDTGKAFAKVCKSSGLDAIILFPQAGPKTEEAWIKASQDENLGVIVGGLMSHACYTRGDGGYLADEAIIEIYINAAKNGVCEFVTPATNPEASAKIKEMLMHQDVDPVIYTPGLGAQGGKSKAMFDALGKRWHAIVGRSIYNSANLEESTLNVINEWKNATS